MKVTIKVTARTPRGRAVLTHLRREQGGAVGFVVKNVIGSQLDARPADQGDTHTETVDLKDLPRAELEKRLILLERDFFERMRFHRANRRDFTYEVLE